MSADSRSHARHLGAAILLVAVFAPASPATIRRVPQDYPRIQAAVDAANTGDEIVVAQGTYSENLSISKGLSVRSTDPTLPDVVQATVINGNQTGCAIILSGDAAKNLTGLTITNGLNPAESAGGITIRGGCATITRCVIADNHGRSAGGIYIDRESNVLLAGCRITGNRSDFDGGGICDDSEDGLRITDSLITANTAGSSGGGVACRWDSRVVATSCIISGNTASADGGGVYLYNSLQMVLSDCLIAGNSAVQGGGAWSKDSYLTLRHCTVAGNYAQQGGGLYCWSVSYSDYIHVTRSILWGNTAGIGPQIALDGFAGAPAEELVVSYSDVQDGQTFLYLGQADWQVTWQPGNINADPLFVSAGGTDGGPATWQDNDYRLLEDSPCVDTGDALVPVFASATVWPGTTRKLAVSPLAWYAVGDHLKYNNDDTMRTVIAVNWPDNTITIDPPLASSSLRDKPVQDFGTLADLAGHSRMVSGHVDIGAYEFGPIAPGDCDGDGAVNAADLVILVTNWGKRISPPGGDARADLNNDGYINVGDLQVLVANWGQGT